MIAEWMMTAKLVKRGPEKVAINVPMDAVRQMELEAGDYVHVTIKRTGGEQ